MKKITIASTVLTLICIALIFQSDMMALAGLYGTFIFGVLSLSLWISIVVSCCRGIEAAKRIVLSCRIFAVVDIITALVLGIIIIINDTGFLAGLATMAYLLYILPVFVIMLIADLFVWSVKTKRTDLSVKIKVVLCSVFLVIAGIAYICLWTSLVGR